MSVLPDVAGLDRPFDYLVPSALAGEVRIGSLVRADLAGRRIGGWVVAEGRAGGDQRELRPLLGVTGWGPEPGVVDLAAWAAWRWAGRRAALLRSASAPGAVRCLPEPATRPPARPGDSAELDTLLAQLRDLPAGLLRLPPATDLTALVALVAQCGPTLVVVPSLSRAGVLAERLRVAGGDVAEVPGRWAAARAGAAVVVGARAAVWAPCPGLAAVVVIDAHDETLVQEQAPTWSAPAVAVERARRAGVPCVLVSPCPTAELVALAPVVGPTGIRERAGWAPLETADRRDDDPRTGLYSPRLVRCVREDARVLCVLNRTGRARLMVCRRCGAVACCEHCGAALAQVVADPEGPGTLRGSGVRSPPPKKIAPGPGSHPLACPRCGATRPAVCAACDSLALRYLRVGVTRVREELEALAGRPVGEVTAATTVAPGAAVVVGTEALLHRAERVDVVAFLDFDQHLLAPRYRAGEEAVALLAQASRAVGGRRRGGRILVQTRQPDHEVILAVAAGDPSGLLGAELEVRRALRLPPASALARVSGPAAVALVESLAPEVERLGSGDGTWLLRAEDHRVLCDALAAAGRPAGRLRLEVDPARA